MKGGILVEVYRNLNADAVSIRAGVPLPGGRTGPSVVGHAEAVLLEGAVFRVSEAPSRAAAGRPRPTAGSERGDGLAITRATPPPHPQRAERRRAALRVLRESALRRRAGPPNTPRATRGSPRGRARATRRRPPGHQGPRVRRPNCPTETRSGTRAGGGGPARTRSSRLPRAARRPGRRPTRRPVRAPRPRGQADIPVPARTRPGRRGETAPQGASQAARARVQRPPAAARARTRRTTSGGGSEIRCGRSWSQS